LRDSNSLRLSEERRMVTRRKFIGGAVAAAAITSASAGRGFGQQSTAGTAIDSKVDGVLLGVQSASFTYSGMGLLEIIRTMREVQLSTIDTMSEHVENFLGAPVQLPGEGRSGPWVPRPKMPPGSRPNFRPDPEQREALRKWRLSVDLDGFRKVGDMFRVAGLEFFSYNLSFDDNYTDEEIDRGFLMTKALGTKIITASSPVEIFPRLKPFAEKHDVIVAIHNHTIGPDDFAKATSLSDKFWVNLDVGHFFASGYDPVAYIKEHHARITNVHIKDRKKNNGDSVPFGDGDTPLPAVFQLLKSGKYGFPACIEYVGPAGPAIELASCRQYCKDTIKSV
jgi:sugar phosphate isomerase/epimerase